MPFLEILFPPNISKGASGGPSFSTVIIAGSNDEEDAVKLWNQGRCEYDVSHATASRAKGAELLAFFYVIGGRYNGFRFKDWLDYSSKDYAGTEHKHTMAACSETTIFQLQKLYSFGGYSYNRKIKKPVSDTLGDPVATQVNSTVHLFDDMDVEIESGWTVDCRTGLVTFDSAPGFTPTAIFEFHIPVRLDTDKMKMAQAEVTMRDWSGIPLIEVSGR